MSHVASHGRGGAGNIGSNENDKVTASDLVTPTVKSSVFTTGRGGSGNMAQNKDAEATRAAQDIEPIEASNKEPTHVGRGGAANVAKPAAAEGEKKQGFLARLFGKKN